VEYIEGESGIHIIVIDEIQKIPELLSIVHQQIEEKKYLQFILTGSSVLKLRRTGVNLLAGRAIVKNCFPFIASEIGNMFSLDNALSFGMLHSKFYYFDAGVFNIIRPKGPLDKPEEIAGPALEGLVLQQLKAWIEYSWNNLEIYFWRTKSGNEVDFILYGENSFYAIEIKNSGSIRKKDLHGLIAFIEDYPGAIPLLLYRGKDKLKIANILCLPVEGFLKQLTPGEPLVG